MLRVPPDQRDDAPEPESRWQLLGNVIAFQFKLAMDGLRDILLSPVSIGALLIGLVASRDDPGRYFRALLRWGHRSDAWINLFGTHGESQQDEKGGADGLMRQAESFIVGEYEKGGVVQNLKQTTDKVIDRLPQVDTPKPKGENAEKPGPKQSNWPD